MMLDLQPLVASPGRRFPIDIRLVPSPKHETGDVTIREIHVVGEAFVQLGTVYFDVDLDSSEQHFCCRCLVPVPTEVVASETFEIVIPPGAESIDPLPAVLEIIDSIRPPRVLCRETCRGLCPDCGADLNEQPDHVCSEPGGDRRTLKDLWV